MKRLSPEKNRKLKENGYFCAYKTTDYIAYIKFFEESDFVLSVLCC